MTRLLKIIAVYIALSAIAAVGALIEIFPKHPTTAAGWALLLLLTLPLVIVGELIGAALWRNRLAQAIEAKTKGRALSGWRILYALAAMLLLFILVFAVGQFT